MIQIKKAKVNRNRRKFIIGVIFFLFMMLILALPVFSADENRTDTGGDGNFEVKIKGYGMVLWTFLDGGGEGSQTLDTNRLRLESTIFYKKRLSLKVIQDLENFTGNFINSPSWSLIRNPQSASYWNLSWSGNLTRSVDFRYTLYRAYLTYEAPWARFDLGKQRIAWGAMRFWRPTDIFNPESPLQIDGGERLGLDAFKFNVPVNSSSDLEGVFSPSKLPGGYQMAGKYHFTQGDYDFSLMTGRLADTRVAGFTFDGYIGDGGFRGEIMRVGAPGRSPYYMWTVGGDYSFPNTLTLTMEYLNNGGAGMGAVNYLLPYDGILRTENRHFLGLGANYQVTPLIIGNLFTSYDISGKSFALTPSFVWSYKENIELSAGYVWFGGKKDGEYGKNPSTLYLKSKIYF